MIQQAVIGIVLIGGLFLIGCGSSKFVRVDAFPKGEQTHMLVGGLMTGLKDTNTVAKVYDAPYRKVWDAALHAAQQFDKIGKRPMVGIDEKNGRIKNGLISQNALIGLSGSSWLDEFFIEATSISDQQTKVEVTRKVVENELNTKTYKRSWKTQLSNGKIENWIHTQIEDYLQGKVHTETPSRTLIPSAPTTEDGYVKLPFKKIINSAFVNEVKGKWVRMRVRFGQVFPVESIQAMKGLGFEMGDYPPSEWVGMMIGDAEDDPMPASTYAVIRKEKSDPVFDLHSGDVIEILAYLDPMSHSTMTRMIFRIETMRKIKL